MSAEADSSALMDLVRRAATATSELRQLAEHLAAHPVLPIVALQPPSARPEHGATLHDQFRNLWALDVAFSGLSEQVALASTMIRRQVHRCQFACSPVAALSDDLLPVVFAMVCSSDDTGASAVTLSHVCHQWRQVAVNQSKLWTRLSVPAFAGSAEASFLQRSSPWGVSLVVQTPSSASAYSLITHPARDRLLNLAVHHRDFHMDPPFIGARTPFSQLRNLVLDGQSGFADLVGSLSFPELIGLSLRRHSHFAVITAPKLKTLELQISPFYFLASWLGEYLPLSPLLESLQVTLVWTKKSLWTRVSELRFRPVELTNLRFFECVNITPPTMLNIAAEILAPSLVLFSARPSPPLQSSGYMDGQDEDPDDIDRIGIQMRRMFQGGRNLKTIHLETSPLVACIILEALEATTTAADHPRIPTLSSLTIWIEETFMDTDEWDFDLQFDDLAEILSRRLGLRLQDSQLNVHPNIAYSRGFNAQTLEKNGCVVSLDMEGLDGFDNSISTL